MVRSRRSDNGQLLPLVALLIACAAGACFLLARVGLAAVDRARAQTAADASALAGAVDGPSAARDLAAANEAVLVSYQQIGADARVEVRVGTQTATARARPDAPTGSAIADRPHGPLSVHGTQGRGAVRGLQPAIVAALERAAALVGEGVPVVSGYRSPAQQAGLFARRARNPYPVAPPGSSMHERGLAVDVPAGFARRLAEVAAQVGLCRPYPRTDPVHFELCPDRGVNRGR